MLRVEDSLLFYRYHPSNTTFSISAETVWKIKLDYFLQSVLNKVGFCSNFSLDVSKCQTHHFQWDTFSIWSAGKLGKQFFKSLPDFVRHKVKFFHDVDQSKLSHGFVNLPYLPDRKSQWVPIKHVAQIESPFVICLKLDLIGFEKILQGFNFVEGLDYYIFN